MANHIDNKCKYVSHQIAGAGSRSDKIWGMPNPK